MHPIVSERACNAHNAFQVSRLVQALFLQPPQPLLTRRPYTSINQQRRNTSTATATAQQDQEPESQQHQLQGEDVEKIINELSIDHIDTTRLNAVAAGDGVEEPARNGQRAGPRFRKFGTTPKFRRKRVDLRNNSLIDPSSLQNTIDLHNAANNAPKDPNIRTIGIDTTPTIKRPAAIVEAQRLQKLKQHFLRKLEEVREKEKNLVVPPDDPGLQKNFLGHLNFEKKEGKANRIAGEKAFLNQVQEKSHHGTGHKYNIHDYEGAYVEATYHEPAPVHELPWAKGHDSRLTGFSRLDAEIRSFYAWVQATPEEKQVREKVQGEALGFVRHYLRQYDAEIFGSQRTGIGIATSDVDIRIFLKPSLGEATLEPETSATPATQDEPASHMTEASSETTSTDEPSVPTEEPSDTANEEQNMQPTANTTSSASDAKSASVAKEPQEPSDMSKAPRQAQRKAHTQALNWLLKKTTRSPFMMAKLRHSRYPLVQAVHRDSGIDVQFVCANDSSNARAKMQQFIQEDPDIVPVFTLLKTLHDVRGLMDVYRGGLGSYTLFMMVVTALRLTWKADFKDNRTVGRKFLAFLRFWGKDADLYKEGFTVEPAGTFDKIHSGWTVPEKKRQRMNRDPILKAQATISLIDTVEPYLLCLQDPADPLNDLGAKTFAIKHIQATYARIFDVINTEFANRGQTKDNPLLLKQPYSFLYFALGPAFNSIEARRSRITRGAGAGAGTTSTAEEAGANTV